MTEYQLREYTIRQGEINQFIEEWGAQIMPLRKKLGFKILDAFANKEESRFVWIVAWDGPGSLDEGEKRYFDSNERTAVNPNPARHVEKSRISKVEYVNH